MPTNLEKFNTELAAAETKIKGDFKKFHQQAVVEVFRRFVLRTPVDQGHAQYNWQINFGGPAVGILQGVDKSDGADTMFRELSKLEDLTPFSLVHITNNVEYISYLEYDKRSPQHPEGMVEITLTEMATWLSGL